MVRAQSLVLVSLLNSELMASPMSTRNTATCVAAGDKPRSQDCLNTSAYPVFLSLPQSFPSQLSSSLPISALSLPFPLPDPLLTSSALSPPHLPPLFSQKEGVAPHPYAPGKAIGTPSESLQGSPSSRPAALIGLLQDRGEHQLVHPASILLSKPGWDL